MQINCWIPSSRPGSRTRSPWAKSSRKNLLRCLRLPGNTSAIDPNAAKSRPSSGAHSWVGKSRAGRRGVGQHVVQKEARKTSEDVHGTEDGREKLVDSTVRGKKSWSQMEKWRRTFSKQNNAELWFKGGEYGRKQPFEVQSWHFCGQSWLFSAWTVWKGHIIISEFS